MALVEFQNNQAPYINADNLNNNFTECNNIIESGSNANGNYVKYSDGTVVCYNTIQGNIFNCTQQAGSGRYYYIDTNNSEENHKNWVYPVTFLNVPAVSVAVSSSAYTMPSTGGVNRTQAVGYCVTPYAVDNITFVWHFIAIGKWK